MDPGVNQTSRSAIRWALIVVGAILLGGVLVNAVWLHIFYPVSAVPSRAVPSGTAAIRLKWQFSGAGPVRGALALGDDGTVFAASEDGFLYALDPSGKLQWKFNAGPMASTPAIGADGTILVTNRDQRVFAISRGGAQRWAVGGGPYADKQAGSIAAAVDATHLYTFWRGQLRAVRLTDGWFDWPAGYGYENGGSVEILRGGLVVYPGVGRIDAVDSTGRIQWQYPVMNPPLTVDTLTKNGGHVPGGNFWLDSGIAIADDGALYACAVDSRLVALTPDGLFKWEFKTKTHSVNRATPLVALDGTVYFASGDGALYALHPDGTQKWAANFNGGSIAATPMLAEDNTVYVVNGNALVAVSPEGEVLASAPIQGGAESSPTLAPDGTVYIASRDRKILAFAGTHGGLQNSAWPKFQGGPANSGRAPSF